LVEADQDGAAVGGGFEDFDMFQLGGIIFF